MKKGRDPIAAKRCNGKWLLFCVGRATLGAVAFMGIATGLAGPAWAGTLSGQALYSGPTVPAREPLKVDKDLHACGHEARFSEQVLVSDMGGTKALQNVVVSVKKVQGGKPMPAEVKFEMDQKKCQFVPHVIVVAKGADLVLKNGDPVMHNLHSYSLKNPIFNESIPAGGKSLTKRFDFTETIKLTCDAHKWMTSWIVVVDNPYYSLTGKNGAFSIGDLPEGKYQVVAWHEVLGKQEKEIEVTASGEQKVTFEFAPKK